MDFFPVAHNEHGRGAHREGGRREVRRDRATRPPHRAAEGVLLVSLASPPPDLSHAPSPPPQPALPAAELAEFRATLSRDRSEAIRRGVHVRGVRLEVMEHSPPLAYGRSLPPQPGSGLGWALCHVARPGRGGGGAWREVEGDAYALALFERPALSAEVVPALCVFAETHLKEAGDE